MYRSILIILFLTSLLTADTITLSNGDRVTGTIVTTGDGKITLKTEFMGEVQINRQGIVAIETAESLNITTESGENFRGQIATGPNRELKVTREDQTELALSLKSLAAVRDDASQRKHEREQERLHNPGLLDFWRITADFGLASAQGNSVTSTVSTGAEAVRRTGFDKTILNFSQIYSTQRTTEPHGRTANRVSGTARYDRDIIDKLFAYGAAQFDFDEFQDLDLRSVLGGGLGYHILKNDNHFWDFGVGGNWNREAFSNDVTRNSAELNVGEESSHQFGSRLKLYQSLGFFPNVSSHGEYRLNFNGGLDLKLNSLFSWTFQATDRFLSNPLPGNKKNDLLFTMGIKFSFEQK